MPKGIYIKSLEHREKIRQALLGKSTWNKGLKNWRPLYRHSEETKIKIGLGVKKENPKSRINELLRKSTAFDNWRREVFVRDDFACQECGIRSQRELRIELHPHHIKEFALFPELRFELSNGVTLCSNCHRNKHKSLRFTEKFTNKKTIKLNGQTQNCN